MRVLVIGVNGQVARSLAARAGAHGASVVTIGRPELDLLEPSTIGPAVARHSPEVIINAAAYTAVDQAESDEAACFAINSEAPRRIARAAAALGAPLIHFSTDYVFDGSGQGWRSEDDPVAPLGVYGRSKLAGEVAIREETKRHVILRTAWVYSPYGRNFVKTMLQLAANRDEVRVVADQTGSPTYALDLADSVFAISRSLAKAADGGPEFGVFHLTGGGSATWAEFAAAIFEASARRGGPTARVVPIPTAEYPTPAKRPLNSRFDNGRVRAVYGVSLPNWRDGLERCLEALQAREA